MSDFENLVSMIEAGYDVLSRSGSGAACEYWRQAWQIIIDLMDSRGNNAVEELDKEFRYIVSLQKWIQDYEMTLGTAGIENKSYYKERIEYCENFLKRYGGSWGEAVTRDMQLAIAVSYFHKGEKGKSSEIFKSLLSRSPKWGVGWVAWANCWMYGQEDDRNYDNAEQILQRGLGIPNVHNKAEILRLLAEIYMETGRNEEAIKINVKQKEYSKKNKVGVIVDSD